MSHHPALPVLTNAMLAACAEARRYLGATAPNPPVGAAGLAADGTVIAVAAHKQAGAEHAEVALIRICRDNGTLDQIHTLCVTLEPCNHHGRTPPCTAAIIGAGIKNVAIGAADPNPNVAGDGADVLRAAGLQVTTGIADGACRQLIAAFAMSAAHGRPWITVKRAFDIHGSMIPPPGQKTFTSPPSLLLAHRLRKKADAILTGSGTILADRPLFTVRHATDHPGKIRRLAIIDRRRRVSGDYLAEAAARGFQAEIYDSPEQVIAALHEGGAQDILIEAGPKLSEYMLKRNLWDLDIAVRVETDGDRVTARLNPAADVPFDPDGFVLENMLPAIA